jgi:hypothetical protein
MSQRSGEEPWIIGFQARGHNDTDGPITKIDGLIRSDINNAEFPVNFVIGGQRVRPDETNGIPRDADFDIASDPFPSVDAKNSAGMPRERFLSEFVKFTFEFNYDGRKYVRHFSREESEQHIARFMSDIQKNTPRAIPQVTRKSTNLSSP